MTQLTRRSALAGAAAITAAAAIGPLTATKPARAATPLAGKQAPGFYRFKVGNFEVTAIYDGIWIRDLDAGFVKNAQFPDVQKAAADGGSPAGKILIPFTTLVVNTGSKLVLLDTGTGARLAPTAGAWMDNFTAAGFDPKAVDIVAISHFHADHINGIRLKDESLTFPNAEVIVPAPEWAHWMDDAKMNAMPEAARGGFMNARRVFNSIAANVKRIAPGAEITTGVTTIPAFGHTPGHVAFALASGSQSFMTIVDATNNPHLFVRNPDWQAVFDTDGNMAADTRKRLLDRAAADKMLVTGYHWPFPGVSYVSKEGSGYRLQPANYSHML